VTGDSSAERQRVSERAIFTAALERANADERAAYLAEACGGDQSLRARVETLLRQHEQLGDFLETPAPELVSVVERSRLPIPEVLGDYQIIREVGRGGMGIVFEARQISLDRRVALKVLPGLSLLGSNRLERFQREAKAAGRLHHTNIVPVYGFGEQDGAHYFVMQFVSGVSLEQVIDEFRALPPEAGGAEASPPAASAESAWLADDGSAPMTSLADSPMPRQVGGIFGSKVFYQRVARLGMQAAEALDYAAQQGVLHRDIKPANLLLEASGQIWVTDFGLAKLSDSDDLTHSGELFGTLRYMPPERFAGCFDARSDVYSLGLTLYELLTLQRPFADAERSRLMAQIVNETPPRPRQFNPAIPRDLETIVMKAIAHEPQARYASAGAMADDLRRFLADRPIHARRTSALERIWRWSRRNPGWTALWSAVALLGVTIVVISMLSAHWLGAEAAKSKLAERQAREQLWLAKRNEAHGWRLSHGPGQRFESLRAIANALQLPVPPGHSLAELRTEAVAALALPDITIEREWQGGATPGTVGLAFDHDLKRCARLTKDGIVSVRRLDDDSLLAQWRENDSWDAWFDEDHLAFSRDGRWLSLGNEGKHYLVVRKLETTGLGVRYRYDATAALARSVSWDGARLAYAADTGVAIVELATGRSRCLPLPAVECVRLEFAPDGRRIAMELRRGRERTVEIRNLATWKVEKTLQQPPAAVSDVHWGNNMRWTADGRTLATSDEALKIRLWDTSSGKLLRILDGHKNHGINFSFDRAETKLLSGDWNAVIHLWDLSSGRQSLSLPAKGFCFLQLNPEERAIAMAASDARKLQLLRLHQGSAFRTIAVEAAGGGLLADRTGQFLAVSRDDNHSLAIVDLAADREIASLPIGLVGGPLAWEPEGTLLTFSRSGLFRWRLPAALAGPVPLGSAEQLLPGSRSGGWAASADRQTLAVAQLDNGALLIHRGSPPRETRLQPQQDVRFCDVSPNGDWVATGSHESTDGVAARVWDGRTGTLIKELPVSPQCRVAFSPDGHWLLTTGGGCRLWKVGTWEEGLSFGGGLACFSPDGRLLAVGDAPGSIRLVECGSGTEVVRLDAPEPAFLTPRCFTRDGACLFAAGETGTVAVWDLRMLRRELAKIGLDWDAPVYPPG
jgi:serine/threonine protein kinase/WD40 repeat protein